jgi:hypothetical protein
MGKSNKGRDTQKITIAQAVRDVLIAAMNKGLFALALVGLIALVIVWKMPGPDVSKLVFGIGQHLVDHSLVGYILSLCLSLGWVAHTKWQRREFHRELDRVTLERNKLQEKALAQKLPSSNG